MEQAIDRQTEIDEMWKQAVESEYFSVGEDEQYVVEVSFKSLQRVTKEFEGIPKLVSELKLNVHKIDGEETYSNKWEISSRALLEKLEPIIKPIHGTDEHVTLRIVRMGKGRGTKYSVAKIN